MIQREVLTQPDGANWHIYHLDRGFVALTSRGRELLHDQPDVLASLHTYRQMVVDISVGRTALADNSGVRTYFASGGNSDLYAVKPELAIKEATDSQSAWSALQRMDRLCSVIEGRVPRWINIPAHYGLLYSANLQRQYTLMQKVDSGITVKDIDFYVTDPEALTPLKLEQVKREFGTVSPADHEAVANGFFMAEALLHGALKAEDLTPKDYLPDFHDGNVLVERSRTPIAGSNFKFWVIDQ